jgi:hypothetical protein
MIFDSEIDDFVHSGVNDIAVTTTDPKLIPHIFYVKFIDIV